ncbi:multidrug effflux MFS transporter [Sanguibacter hominis]
MSPRPNDPVSAPPAPRGAGFKWVLMLGALAALPAITVDMYLPSLPTVALDLRSTAAAAQLTVSGMLLGGAVGQLVIGPFSDRFGRRLPVLIGVAAHVLVSLACIVAPTIEILIALRVLQGFCNAAASVVAIAVIRDRFVGAEAARLLSRLMLVIGVAPLFAPTVGGAIASRGTWHLVFAALAVIGAVLLVIVWRFMPETLPGDRRRIAGPRGVSAGYASLLKDKKFMAVAVIPGLGQAVIMSYVVGSTFVLQEEYGLSEQQFAIAFAINGVALVGSAQLNAALVRRVSPMRILRVALVVQMGLGAALVAVTATGAGGLVALLCVLWLVLGMQGMIPANASMIALTPYGHMAGTAAALMGAMQAGLAGLISPLVGVLGGTAVAMAAVMTLAVALAVTVLAVATPAYRRGGAWGDA